MGKLPKLFMMSGILCGPALMTAGVLLNKGFMITAGIIWLAVSVSRVISLPKEKKAKAAEEKREKQRIEEKEKQEKQERQIKRALIRSWNIPKQVINAQRGSQYAQYMLGRAYLEGIGVEVDEAKGLYWLEQAAEQNHEETYEYIKYLYERQGTQAEGEIAQSIRNLYEKYAVKRRNRELSETIAKNIQPKSLI